MSKPKPAPSLPDYRNRFNKGLWLRERKQEILRYFSGKWLYPAQRLKQGDDYSDFRIEQIADRPKVGRLVEDRALRLQRWVDEESLW